MQLLTGMINGEEDDCLGQRVHWDNVGLHAVCVQARRIATHPLDPTHQLEEPVILV